MTADDQDQSGYVPPDVESHDVGPHQVDYREPDMTSHDVEAPPSPPYVPPYIHDEKSVEEKSTKSTAKATQAKGNKS